MKNTLKQKIKRLVEANVEYLVQDPNDSRIGIKAQEQMEGFIFSWMKEEIALAVNRERKHIQSLCLDEHNNFISSDAERIYDLISTEKGNK